MSTHQTSQTAVWGAGKANVAPCFTVLLGMDGKSWTMRVRRERRHSWTRKGQVSRSELYKEGIYVYVSNYVRCLSLRAVEW